MADKEAKIIFKAVTSEMDKGIKSMNADIKGLSTELKLNATQLKGNESSVKLLRERQSLLSTEYEKSRQKVQLTSQKLEEAKRIFGENSTEVKNLENSLLNAKNQEEAIKNEIENTNKKLKDQKNAFQKAGDKISDFGGKVTGVGKTLMPVSAGAVALGTAAVSSAMTMDEAYDIVITKTGATGEALDDLTGVVNDLFTTLPIDADTAGIAVGEVNTRFQETGESCQALCEQFIEFANINDTDLNSSIDNVDSIMTKFNVNSSDVVNVLGLLTKTGQDTGLSIDTLESSLMSNGTTLKEMGLDVVSSTKLLAQFETNGVDASTAMAGLKKASKNATEEGKTLGDALGETIENIKNASTETEALQIATDLFGTKGAPEMTQAIREGKFSIDDTSGSLKDYGTTVTDTFNATLDPWDEAKVAANNLKLAASDMGTTMLGEAAPAIEGLTTKVKELTTWFTNLDTGTQMTIIKVGAAVAIAAPAIMIIGSIISGIGAIVSAGGALIGFISGIIAPTTAATAATAAAGTAAGGAAVGVTALSLPLVAIVAIIAAVIAAGVLLYKNWDTIKQKAGELKTNVSNKFKEIKTSMSESVGEAKTYVTGKLNEIKTAYDENGGGIKGTVAATMTAVKMKYQVGYDAINLLTNGKLDEMTTKMKTKFREQVRDAKEQYEDIKAGVTEKINGAKDNVHEAIEKIKGFFNFSWSLPPLKIPEFHITGKFSLNPPSVPDISIRWHKNGGILNGATIFGQQNGTLLGGGEAGREVVSPLDTLINYVEDAVNNAFSQVQSEGINYNKLADAIVEAESKQEYKIIWNKRETARFVKGVTV